VIRWRWWRWSPHHPPVTLDEMIHHNRAVARGLSRAPGQQPLLIAICLPESISAGLNQAVAASRKGFLRRNGGRRPVKLEGLNRNPCWLVGSPGA